MEPLQVFVTGGTFDKEYDELKGSMLFKDTHIREMLEHGRNEVELDIRTLMMVDSLDMTDKDRGLILQNCIDSIHKQIIITHGTDTMAETAKVIGEAKLDKTIVLTGAMRPYTFGSSDGMFNLGAAIAFAQLLPSGAYIAMDGLYFEWNNVRKNKDKGIFEKLR